MLLWLTQLFASFFHGFNVFQYLTLRAILSTITAFSMSLMVGPMMIRYLSSLRLGQPVRDDGPQTHFTKQGTPTMGGVLILMTITMSTLLWGELANKYIWIVLLITLGFGAIGWYDDMQKLRYNNAKGLSASKKYLLQSLLALLAGSVLYFTAYSSAETQLVMPFFKHMVIDLGPLFILLCYFVIVGTSNAVNLTDGLDGLAILPTVMIAAALGIFAYASGNSGFAAYLHIPYLPDTGEVVVFCAAMVGAGLGFLWFNTYPAQVFMGDVGSLGLGAALAMVAVVVRQEIVFFIMSGLFVAETLSVILQVLSFKLRGKRIFRMAPLHHHFELKGWPEPKVIVRFWIVTFILVLCGLATLKLR